MKNHIISLFIIALSFIVLDSCKNEETINILSIEISKNPNIVMENYNKFFSSHNTSIHFAHLNFRLINKELIITALSVNLKNLYIYNCDKDSLIERNLNDKDFPPQPVLSIYTQSYDSIFFLFENINTVDKEIHNKGNTEMILFNDKMKVLKKYNLDSIPYFFSSEENSLIENNILNYQNRIFHSNLLFPMTIYSPSPSEDEFVNFHPNQMCYIDLYDGHITQINAKFPKEDIGKHFNDELTTTILQYYILSSDSILFTFPHTSTIYLIDLKTEKSIVYKKFVNFPFQNSSDDNNENKKVFSFEPLVFSSTKNLFFRKIKFHKYNNKQRTTVVQVLDKHLNQLGFIVDTTKRHSFITCYGLDPYILDSDSKKFYSFSINSGRRYSLKDFEDSFLLDKVIKKEINTKSITTLPVNFRFKIYLKELGIKNTRKIVIINTDQMCSSCVDYLMSLLQEHQAEFVEAKIQYLFIGSNIENAVDLISHYHIKSHINFDINQVYNNYFNDVEIVNYHLIKIEQDEIIVDTTSYQNFYSKVGNFLSTDY